MVLQPVQGVSPAALQSLAAAGREVAVAADLDDALTSLAAAAASATGATVAVIRVADRSEPVLHARGVWAASAALKAELEGSRVAAEAIGTAELTEADELPEPVNRLSRRWSSAGVLVCPVVDGERVVAALELVRRGETFNGPDVLVARVVANHAALLVRALGAGDGTGSGDASTPLELTARALAVVAEEAPSADRIARLALEAAGARSCLLWRATPSGPRAAAAVGAPEDLADPAAVAAEGEAALGGQPAVVEGAVVLVRLGEPSIGGMRLVFDDDRVPGLDESSRLISFGARAAHALRAAERTSDLAQELERSRALLAVVGQAISELSLSHTLDTAVDRVAELLETDRAAVYLRQGGGLETAAERGLAGPHLRVAEALLDLVLGHLRARGVVEVRDARADPRLGAARGS